MSDYDYVQNKVPRQEDEPALGPVQAGKLRTISERRLQANRANAKKSTGPRTARGKCWSRRNALRHGLTSELLLFKPNDPQLQTLSRNLYKKFATVDEQTDATLEKVVVEWMHQQQLDEIESKLLENGLDDSNLIVSLRNLLRYRTTSRRALLKNLAQLGRRTAKD